MKNTKLVGKDLILTGALTALIAAFYFNVQRGESNV